MAAPTAALKPTQAQQELQELRELSPQSQFRTATHSVGKPNSNTFQPTYHFIKDPTPHQSQLVKASSGSGSTSNHPRQAPVVAQQGPPHVSEPPELSLGIQSGRSENGAHVPAPPPPHTLGQPIGPVMTYHAPVKPYWTTPPNAQLHHPKPLHPFTFNSQDTPSPTVTPNSWTPAETNASTPNETAGTPATTPAAVPISNLPKKAQAAKNPTRVEDIVDPMMCHLCFHMVVLKGSIKNHLVSVHGWKKEDVKKLKIHTRSELLAQGYKIPPDHKPKRITSNQEAASASSRKRYALSLNPPSLAAVVAGDQSGSAAPATNIPAIGGVFTGVNLMASQPLNTLILPPLSHVSSGLTVASTKSPTGSVASQGGSMVPAKRTYEIANALEIKSRSYQPAQPANGANQSEVVAEDEAASSRLPTAIPVFQANGDLKDPQLLAPGPTFNTGTAQMPPAAAVLIHRRGGNLSASGIDGQPLSVEQLMDIARAALSMIPEDMGHESSNGLHRPAKVIPDQSIHDSVLDSVNYHEGTIAAASVKGNLEAMNKAGGEDKSRVSEEREHKRHKMSYGEILVPENYVPDERLADVNRDEANASEGRFWVTRTNEDGRQAEKRDMPDIEVYDDR